LIDDIVEEMSIGLGLVKYQIYYQNLQRGRGNRVISRKKLRVRLARGKEIGQMQIEVDENK